MSHGTKDTELVKFSPPENQFIKRLLSAKEGERLENAFPDSMDPTEVLEYVEGCSGVLVTLEKASRLSIPVLGRLLAIVEAQQLWHGHYPSYQEYEQVEVKNKGVSPDVLSLAKKSNRVLGELSLESIGSIGPRKMRIVANVAEGKSTKQKMALVDRANRENETVDQFRAYVENESGLSHPGATSSASFQLYGTTEQVGQLKEWLADPGMVLYMETSQPIQMILDAFVNESATEEYKAAVKKAGLAGGEKLDW